MSHTTQSTQSPSLTLRGFVRRHRPELDYFLRRYTGIDPDSLTDHSRARWVLRDPGLQSWAEEEGVRLDRVRFLDRIHSAA